MDRRAAWVLGIVFGGMFVSLFGFLLVLYFAVKSDGADSSKDSGPDRVGVIEVSGTIMDSKRTLKELNRFADAEHVKAIVLRIDSPGGAVGPSQEIYDAIKRIKAKKKVIASMGSLAASGGYYIACATDKIYANPGTLTGSIGVIMEMPNVQGLLKWAGVEMNTLKAGKMKDSGSPFREMTPEERAYFEGMLADVHAQFIEAVAAGRKLTVEEVTPLADGRVFSGRQAKEAKLVDELGGIEAAIAEAGKLGGITGEPKTEYPRKDKKLLRELMGDDDEVEGLARTVLGKLSGASVQYRMSP
ncbi:MAG: signal peptide peptidase SppA [Archangiaceae bacterium]|nr:signal peptide peptidase SppA [Archangiaceae bacterium]